MGNASVVEDPRIRLGKEIGDKDQPGSTELGRDRR